jgi:hypothetical protein
MSEESQAIEVEVVEIDGVAPSAKVGPQAAESPQRPWRGAIRKLDRRWMPLWILLGAIALVVVLVGGLVVGAVVVIFRILRGIVRLISG